MTGTIVEIDLPSNEFALQRTLTVLPTVRFDIERVVAHGERHTMPFVWMRDGDDESIDRTLGDDPSVSNHQRIADLNGRRLYRIDCVDDVHTLVQLLIGDGGTILAASGRDDRWTLRLLFPERTALSRTYETGREFGLGMEIRRIYELDEHHHEQFGLSTAHRETLITAFERGYYDVPRGTTLSELAAELDVSHQALSERLRRSYRALIKYTVVSGGIDWEIATNELPD